MQNSGYTGKCIIIHNIVKAKLNKVHNLVKNLQISYFWAY
jgi:hypothetical protein